MLDYVIVSRSSQEAGLPFLSYYLEINKAVSAEGGVEEMHGASVKAFSIIRIFCGQSHVAAVAGTVAEIIFNYNVLWL